jgi:hypothetical protein
MTDDSFCRRFDRASRKGTGLGYPVKRCGAATLSRHSNLTKRCPLWVIFDRSSRFCLLVDVRLAPKATLDVNGGELKVR